MKQAVVMLMMAQQEDEEDSDDDEDDLDDDDDGEIGDGKPADILSAKMQTCFSMLTLHFAACMWCSAQNLPDDRLRRCSVCMLLQL